MHTPTQEQRKPADAPLLSDDLLQSLANPVGTAVTGDWDIQTRAMLAVIIPQMAAELLVTRHRCGIVLRPDPKAVEQSLEDARALIRSADPVHPRQLRMACETLLLHSKYADERTAADHVLREMREAA